MQIIVFIILVSFLALWIFLNWYQSQVLFNPLKELKYTPDIPHEEFYVGGLHGWYFNNHPGNKTVLHNHCNYGNIGLLKEMVQMCDRQKFNLIVYDYHGYGKSLGRAHPENIYTNGETIYEYLVHQCNVLPEDIIVWGESLGGTVATHIASKYDCHALVLLATFASLNDLFVDTFPKFSSIANERILKYMFYTLPSKDKIQKVKCPIAIVHSAEDDLIPISNARKMYNSISHDCKLMVEIKGIHSKPNMTVEQLEKVLNFIGTDSSRCCYVKDILEEIAKKDDW